MKKAWPHLLVLSKMAANRANDAVVRGFLHQLLHSIVRQIENNDGRGDNADGILYRVDWLYNCLVRYVGSYNIDENIVRLVVRSRDMLEDIQIVITMGVTGLHNSYPRVLASLEFGSNEYVF